MAFNDPGHVHAVSDVNMNGKPFSYVYDANGNMIQGPDLTDPSAAGTRTIDYNADNMPVRITTGASGVTDIVYDGENKRAKKTTAGKSTLYVSEDFEIIGGAPVKYIFAGNLRVAEVSSSGVLYYHKDHLGSTTVMTDAAGIPREQTEHLPFGGSRNPDGGMISSYKFTDQELDKESGLYNYDARLYDPVVGQFISADRIIPKVYDPQTLNRFAYTRNNPLKYNDPDGHVYQLAIPAAISAFDYAASTTLGITIGVAIGQFSSNVFLNDSDEKSNPYSDLTDDQLAKAEKSYGDLIKEHENKLDDYINDPDAYDHLGKLQNASPEIRDKIVEGRINALEKDIKKQKNELEKIQEEKNNREQQGSDESNQEQGNNDDHEENSGEENGGQPES
jgi:RHS repeat-associated protein